MIAIKLSSLHLAFICSCLFFLLPFFTEALPFSDQKTKVLYNSLDPYSVSQHLAFYELYSKQPIGQQALHDAWQLISGSKTDPQANLSGISFSSSIISSIVALVNKPLDQESILLNDTDLREMEKLSARLSHFHLKGHHAQSELEVLQLPPEEIDLARGLFLSQFGSDINKVKTYEAMIDLMALQIAARLPPEASQETKIRQINRYIFEEMGFRFPPHSLFTKNIDLYTFLPSVLDSHQGVCLGVSILYLCIAQRLNLPLEMVTPPGHIYVRYRSPQQQIINIETTARGIHLDSKDYLNIKTRSLQQRTIKEVIGLAHFNQAGAFLQQKDYINALTAYQKAQPYLINDSLLKELMGYSYLFVGDNQTGEELLRQIKDDLPEYSIIKDSMAEDYLLGRVDAQSLKTIFAWVAEDRSSLLTKKQQLEEIVKHYPHFRSGILHLAFTWLQLHRAGEALEILKYYQNLDSENPEVNYYLAALYGERHDYNQAWAHLRQVEKIVQAHQYEPQDLKDLRKHLATYCPE